jgi:CRP-like cAMP-binding protein
MDNRSRRSVPELLLGKIAGHAALLPEDELAVRGVSARTRALAPGEDVVRQGDRPEVAVMVLSGMLARYQTLRTGDRQYISFHLAGDLPDIQSLFLTVMDHSLCALNTAEVALLPHEQLQKLIIKRPAISFALWRVTLADGAIFRQAVTNNGARDHLGRLAHLFCEMYVRAREAGLADGKSCSFPVSQVQLGQALGMSHISVNRALQRVRKARLADLRSGRLEIFNWSGLKRTAGFDPAYLHLKREAEIANTTFKVRRVR